MMRFLDRQVSDTQIKLGSRLWLYVISSIILFLLIVPSLIVIPMSFSDSQYLEFPPEKWSIRWYEEYWETPRWINATITSLQVAFFTMLLATPIGTMAAYGLFVSGSKLGRYVFFLLMLVKNENFVNHNYHLDQKDYRASSKYTLFYIVC